MMVSVQNSKESLQYSEVLSAVQNVAEDYRINNCRPQKINQSIGISKGSSERATISLQRRFQSRTEDVHAHDVGPCFCAP